MPYRPCSMNKSEKIQEEFHCHINFDDLINQRDICELSHFRLEEFLAEEEDEIRSKDLLKQYAEQKHIH